MTAFWDGAIHKSRLDPLDGSGGRQAESWRFMESGMMARARPPLPLFFLADLAPDGLDTGPPIACIAGWACAQPIWC